MQHFEVVFDEGGAVFPVRVGEMDPVDELSGMLKRLRSLGYAYVPPRHELDAWQRADLDTIRHHELLNYQQQRGLEPNGTLDDATRQALVADYGC